MMRVGSVCSGIGGAELAFEGLAAHAFAAETDPFARAVLSHHFPDIPLYGDFTEIGADAGPVDVLVGGTPCQSFSIAGLRRGMEDQRGNLALEFLRLADRLRARWVLWENVPGVLSSDGGRDFGAFLGGLAELGYGWAYRVLDAQFFRLAQRRKRVFVVGYLGDWRRAAAVLFEPACLRGDSAPRREARERVAPTLSVGAHGSSGHQYRQHPSRSDGESETFVTHSLRADGFDASEDGTGRGTPLVTTLAIRGRGDSHDLEWREDGTANAVLTPNGGRGGIGVGAIAYRTSPNCGAWDTGDRIDALTTGTDPTSHVVAFDTTQVTSASNYSVSREGDPCHPLASTAHPPAVAFTLHGADKTVSTATETQLAGSVRTKPPGSIENSSTTAVLQTSAVRRLTPRECERLQGFRDGWTLIPYRGKPAADGPRYRALGNAFAVPVVRWIARRLVLEDAAEASAAELAA